MLYTHSDSHPSRHFMLSINLTLFEFRLCMQTNHINQTIASNVQHLDDECAVVDFGLNVDSLRILIIQKLIIPTYRMQSQCKLYLIVFSIRSKSPSDITIYHLYRYVEVIIYIISISGGIVWHIHDTLIKLFEISDNFVKIKAIYIGF